jgi:hypothetical protein
MGVVNIHRKEGGHVQPDLGGQYHRILQQRQKNVNQPLKKISTIRLEIAVSPENQILRQNIPSLCE